jgi:light-regulated signal transduction histidine kinase (bacteriophytochrome)
MGLKNRYTVLVIDDSLEDSETYRRYLNRDLNNSYDIHVAHYAAEGLRFCSTQWPDLILLDFLLPDLTGLQFLDALQQNINGQTLPAILVLTGQGNEEVAVAFMKKGVRDYLLKNKITEDGLQLIVRQILHRVQLENSLKIQRQWQLVLSEVSLRIRQSLDLSHILNATVVEIKQFLSCDRVVVFQFGQDWQGTIIAEAVGAHCKPALGAQVVDTCFEESKAQLYREGRQKVINDIYQAGLSECHIRLLEEFQVRSVLIVPILVTSDSPESMPNLWGLLIVHQCQQLRQWTSNSTIFLGQLSVQLAIAIQQSELLKRLNQELVQRAQTEQNLSHHAEEQERLIQVLDRTTKLLEQHNEDLNSFVSVVSHDLRAPLRAVRNLTIWLSEDLADVLDADSKMQFGLLAARVDRMEALLNSLLQYARLGRLETSVANVHVAELLREIVDGLAVPPEFTIQFAPDSLSIVTDRIALEQVLTNLIENAINHHPRPNGRVEITVVRQGEFYEFEVADDGAGIAPQHHQNIFKIFKTVNNIVHPNSTGVGLAIVKKSIELQGGTITLESEVGKGTTFRFTWPIG